MLKEEFNKRQYDLKAIIPKGNIAILIISSCIASAGNIALVFLPIYFTSLGGTVLQYGIITVFATLIGIPSTIMGGAMTYRHGLKKIIVMASWLGPSVLIGYYFSHSWIVLCVPILLGAAGSLGSVATRQLVADGTIQENRTAQLSLYQTLTAIPSIVTPLVGGYLVHTFGTGEGFRLGILIALAISPIPIILLIKYLRQSNQGTTATREEHPGAVSLVLDRYRNFYSNLALLPRVLVPLLVVYASVIVASSMVNPYLIFYSTNIAKLDTFQWGMILSLQVLFANIARTPLGILSDRFDKRKVLLVSLIATAPLPVFLAFENSFWAILGIMLAMVAAGINYRPTHEALQIELTPRQRRPALFVIYDILTNLCTSAGTLIGALFFTISYTIPFYSFTVIEIFAAMILALSFFRQKEKKSFVGLISR